MNSIDRWVESNSLEITKLLQQFIQIPSPTYQEGEYARFVAKKLAAMNMDVELNSLGDVTGFSKGNYSKEGLLILNTHLDQAEAGEMPDAYLGKIMDGSQFGVDGEVITGRGANAQKACLAAMIFAAKAIQELGVPLQRGYAINAGVMEECGGHLSPQYLVEEQKTPIYAVICGEHTNLLPVNAQRGMGHVHLEIIGKGAHAAAPENSSSAMIALSKAVLSLEELNKSLPKDSVYGNALVSLNKVHISPNVINAIPDLAQGVIDVRYPFTCSLEQIVEQIKEYLNDVLASQRDLKFVVEVRKKPVKSYTGVERMVDGGMLPFFTEEKHPLVVTLQNCIEDTLNYRPEARLWSISSEAGYFSRVIGAPVVCFGPGEDQFTHNNIEHVKIEDVILTTKIYAKMILNLCA